MLECVTEAIVLHKESCGESDMRVFLYTERWGKIIAQVTSARNIASKLNPHLEPLNLVTVRVVHKNKTRLVDALVTNSAQSLRKQEKSARAFRILQLVNTMTQEWFDDAKLWQVLKEGVEEGNISSHRTLEALGFNPRLATCTICNKKPTTFLASDQQFYCQSCVSRCNRSQTR